MSGCTMTLRRSLDGGRAGGGWPRVALLCMVCCVAVGSSAPGAESAKQGHSADGEWRHHGGDHASSRYSPAAQIDGSNFGQLDVAWRWRSADHEVPLDVLPGYDTGHYRSVPLMIGGRLFAPTSLGQVALLDPATGEQQWVYNPRTWERGGTTMRHITHGAPPIVVGNSVIVGSKIFDYSVRSDAPPGHVRAYDVHTGERIWHFQTVHHGIWDYDIASPPNLIDIVTGGKLIKAVAQVSKTGFTYVFDRATGEPVWLIEERPVNGKSTVAAEKLVLAPMFPPLIVQGEGGKEGVLVVPGAGGGANWPGASVDPMTGTLFVESQNRPTGMSLVAPDAARSDWRYVIDYVDTSGPQGLPLTKPPYRTITAIDLNRGEHRWRVPVGAGPKNHPAIAHLNLGDMGTVYFGMPAEGGLLVTRTLLIGFVAVDEDGDRSAEGGLLRGYDKATGELLAEVETDIWLHGPPMTYMHQGRQYIVVAGGGARNRRVPDELIAFALPESAIGG